MAIMYADCYQAGCRLLYSVRRQDAKRMGLADGYRGSISGIIWPRYRSEVEYRAYHSPHLLFPGSAITSDR